jgi:inorganic pyrophosphatase
MRAFYTSTRQPNIALEPMARNLHWRAAADRWADERKTRRYEEQSHTKTRQPPAMNVQVFIQNEAGSDQKNYHDERRLIWQRAVTVSKPYPFPYGFIVATTADDGGNIDAFVITDQPLKTGQLLECEVLGLMEQFEDGHIDHNVLVRPAGSSGTVDDLIRSRLSTFVMTVFSHVPGKDISVGQFLDAVAAQRHIARSV